MATRVIGTELETLRLIERSVRDSDSKSLLDRDAPESGIALQTISEGFTGSIFPDGTLVGGRKLSYYAVLFIDLLGQRDAIESLQNLNLLQNDRPTYCLCLGEIAGKIWAVRNFLEVQVGTRMAKARPSAAYPVPKVTFQMFSDTIMVYFLWEPENPNAFIALKSLVVASAETMIVALASGVPIRGGLDVDLAIEFRKQAGNPLDAVVHGGDIWGPAPKKAYELSEGNDNYMRVRVGHGAIHLVKASADCIRNEIEQIERNPSTRTKITGLRLAVDAAKDTAALLAKDPVDDLPIIDYLGQNVDRILMPEALRFVDKAIAFAQREYERLRIDPNPKSVKIAGKYKRLLQYADARQFPNGIVPGLARK